MFVLKAEPSEQRRDWTIAMRSSRGATFAEASGGILKFALLSRPALFIRLRLGLVLGSIGATALD